LPDERKDHRHIALGGRPDFKVPVTQPLRASDRLKRQSF
jgi:hypothetical protein